MQLSDFARKGLDRKIHARLEIKKEAKKAVRSDIRDRHLVDLASLLIVDPHSPDLYRGLWEKLNASSRLLMNKGLIG
jgi:hypothetical protein